MTRKAKGKRDWVEGKSIGRPFGGPSGKPTGREEFGKSHGEEEPNGPDGPDELAVPDYVMRDFGLSE